MTYQVSRVTVMSRPAGAPPVAWGVGPAGADDGAPQPLGAHGQRRTLSWPATLAWLGVTLLAWAVSYLIRQPAAGAALATAAMPSFLIEGMLLALTWLGLIVAGCVAVLAGTVEIHLPGDER